MFGYLGFTFPAGAVLYWVIGSVLSMIQQYVISGWGSLANYLKFLPTTGGLLPPATPLPATSSVSSAPVATEAPAAEKVGFWDVLRPLTEPSGTSNAPDITESDQPTEQAINEARRQLEQDNQRRRKARR
jgi:YidC/Oxa1 family membrane protein insertase